MLAAGAGAIALALAVYLLVKWDKAGLEDDSPPSSGKGPLQPRSQEPTLFPARLLIAPLCEYCFDQKMRRFKADIIWIDILQVVCLGT